MSWSSSLCNFHHSSLTSSLLGHDFLLRTSFFSQNERPIFTPTQNNYDIGRNLLAFNSICSSCLLGLSNYCLSNVMYNYITMYSSSRTVDYLHLLISHKKGPSLKGIVLSVRGWYPVTWLHDVRTQKTTTWKQQYFQMIENYMKCSRNSCILKATYYNLIKVITNSFLLYTVLCSLFGVS
jgi:hypothetical protein